MQVVGTQYVPKLIIDIVGKYCRKELDYLYVLTGEEDPLPHYHSHVPDRLLRNYGGCYYMASPPTLMILSLPGTYRQAMNLPHMHGTLSFKLWYALLLITLHEVKHHIQYTIDDLPRTRARESEADMWAYSRIAEAAHAHPDLLQPMELGWLGRKYKDEYRKMLRSIRSTATYDSPEYTELLHDVRARRVRAQLSATHLACNVLDATPKLLGGGDRKLVVATAAKLGLGKVAIDHAGRKHRYYLYGDIHRVKEAI